MNKLAFYPKMAASNIIKNGKFYIPYILTSVLSVAMFFNMYSFLRNDSLPGGNSFRTLMSFGIVVVGFFCAIFLFYTNSFLIKRRKKEFGLYNILGMEKIHVSRLISLETLMIGVAGIGVGIIAGALLDKLMFMLVDRFLGFDSVIEYSFNWDVVLVTAVFFAVVFALILIKNIIEIYKSKPVELLAGGNVGEKEPRVKWFLVLLGTVSLGGGYILAITTTNAVYAITYFFIAVILVMIGTYCLFIAGSIAILKSLKKNKKYYYQPKHFSSVSGMLYRMKQNAVGLANICILSTMIIVMLSTTVSLYAGMNDILNQRFPTDMNVLLRAAGPDDKTNIKETIEETSAQTGLKTENFVAYEDLMVTFGQKGNEFTTNGKDRTYAVCVFDFMTPENYKAYSGQDAPKLKSGEIGVYAENGEVGDTVKLLGREYKVVHIDSKVGVPGQLSIFASAVYLTVVPDDAAFKEIYDAQYAAYTADGMNGASLTSYTVNFDVEGKDEEALNYNSAFKQNIDGRTNASAVLSKNRGIEGAVTIDNRQEGSASMQEFYGGFLFLGIYLGILFLTATVLIIYYKQMVEGYDDRKRFVIMQNVGMDKKEVKDSIRSQTLIMFFLPLGTAIIHMAFAFKMMTHLLKALMLTNIQLFLICTIITVLVYAIVYAIVYRVTAKTYYNIVSE